MKPTRCSSVESYSQRLVEHLQLSSKTVTRGVGGTRFVLQMAWCSTAYSYVLIVKSPVLQIFTRIMCQLAQDQGICVAQQRSRTKCCVSLSEYSAFLSGKKRCSIKPFSRFCIINRLELIRSRRLQHLPTAQYYQLTTQNGMASPDVSFIEQKK